MAVDNITNFLNKHNIPYAALRGGHQGLSSYYAKPRKSLSDNINLSSQVRQRLENSVVLTVVPTAKSIFIGTGFFIAPGLIFSNAHNLDDITHEGIYVYSKALRGRVKATILKQSKESKRFKFMRASRDYTVLRISQTNHPTLAFDMPYAGQKAETWGFPDAKLKNDHNLYEIQALSTKVSIPRIIITKGEINYVVDGFGGRALHTMSSSYGNSGGPIVNEDGNVIGIFTWVSKKLNTKSSSINGYHQALSAKDAVDFLRENNFPYRVAAGSELR